MTASLVLDTNELQKISELPTELALQQAAAFLESQILPLTKAARDREDWYVARRWDGEDGSYSLQVFVWPAGSRTKIHDHSSWGAYCCAVGSVLEERYERLDDGSWPDHARLKKVWQLSWSAEAVPPRCGPATEVSTGWGTQARIPRSRCTFTAPGWERWMAGTTIPPAATSATGQRIRG
jgi:hypothetical protein